MLRSVAKILFTMSKDRVKSKNYGFDTTFILECDFFDTKMGDFAVVIGAIN